MKSVIVMYLSLLPEDDLTKLKSHFPSSTFFFCMTADMTREQIIEMSKTLGSYDVHLYYNPNLHKDGEIYYYPEPKTNPRVKIPVSIKVAQEIATQ